jgi:hypothetical protein
MSSGVIFGVGKMLANLIKANAAESAAKGDWPSVADTLNAKTVVVRDPTPVTYAMLTRDLGDEARQLVAGTLRAVAKMDTPEAGEIADAHSVLLNERGGLSLDTDTRQAIVTKLAVVGNWPDSVRDAIKAKGVRVTSIAGTDVTSDQCKVAFETDALQSAWVSWLNETVNPLVANGDRTGLNAALAGKQF